jgi:hypothetical protein
MRRSDDLLAQGAPYSVVGIQPILYVPTVLEKRPYIVLVIDVSPRLVRLHSVQKPACAIELGSIAGQSAYRCDSAHVSGREAHGKAFQDDAHGNKSGCTPNQSPLRVALKRSVAEN